MCPQALDLARDLCAADGPIIALRRSPVPIVATVVRPYAAAGWSVADVQAAAESRLAGRTALTEAVRPVSWLKWLLADADPEMPPRQIEHAEQAERGERRRAATAAARAQADDQAQHDQQADASVRQAALDAARAVAVQGSRDGAAVRAAGDRREANARRAALVQAALDSWSTNPDSN